MNRAHAIRYGAIDNNHANEGALEAGTLQDNVEVPATLTPLRPFGSHQILVSCITERHVKMGTFLSRDLPSSVIRRIQRYLDLRSANLAKRLFERPKLPKNNYEGSVVAGFGSKAKLAMTVLSNRYRPYCQLKTLIGTC